MNLKQLIDAVNEDMDESYPNATITRWINEGYCALSDIVKLEKKATLESGEQPLPSDFQEVHPNTTLSYSIFGDSITSDGGDFYYYAELQPLADPTESPRIPIQFHDVLIHYAVARLQFTEEELDGRTDRMDGYNNRLADLKRYYDKRRAMNTPLELGVVYHV